MNLPMVMSQMIKKTLMKMIQLIQLFKIPDSVLMPDFGLFIKRNLKHMLKSITNINITTKNTLMSLPMEMFLMIRKT
jgi:hypothetical protein